MITIYTDGASLGNPGRVGIGYLIYKNGQCLARKRFHLGDQSNNFAEYMGLIFSLIDALAMGEKECRVFCDSQLVCEQINGRYKVKNNNIFSLFVLAKELISKFNGFTISHIPREKNHDADKLAKEAASLSE